eukprot:g7530.t1
MQAAAAACSTPGATGKASETAGVMSPAPPHEKLADPANPCKCVLRVTADAPPQFFCRQGGRKEGFVVRLQLEESGPGSGRRRVRLPPGSLIHVDPELVYSCSRAVVPPTGSRGTPTWTMFRGPAVIQSDGSCTIEMRIDDVSANHQDRRFALRLALKDATVARACGIEMVAAFTYAGQVQVLSKQRRKPAPAAAPRAAQGGAKARAAAAVPSSWAPAPAGP